MFRYFDGTAGNDVLNGTTDSDIFDVSQGGSDTVDGGDGNDWASFADTFDSTDRVMGGAGDTDEIDLSGYYDNLTITRSMAIGVEFLVLYEGTYSFTFSSDLLLDNEIFTVFPYYSRTYTNITSLDASAVIGDIGYYSTSGTDTATTGSGDDFFRYTAGGTAIFDGGSGMNRVSLFGAEPGVVFDLRVRRAQSVGSGSITIRNFQNVAGTTGADTLTGTSADNWFVANGGEDVLRGLGGDDLFTLGRTGSANAENGVVDGGRNYDIIDFSGDRGSISGVTVSLAVDEVQETGRGSYTFTAIEGITGTLGEDQLTGNGQANRLFGWDGVDRLIGAAGDDDLYGDAAYTTTNLSGFAGPRTIDFNLGAIYNDFLDGGRGRDQLDGGGGDDILIGGTDADRLTGGTGNDVFKFNGAEDSARGHADRIQDFIVGDRIDVSRIDADPSIRGNQAFHLGTTPGRSGDIVIIYDQATDTTTLNLFVDSDERADMVIKLTGDIALAAADFIL